MSRILQIKSLDEQVGNKKPSTADAGYLNIFPVEDLLPLHKKSASYSRRDYYKVSLVTGHSKIHYADHSAEVDGSALVFTNPLIPYFWEPVSVKQTGFVCIFTEAFFSRSTPIRNYPVFQFADRGVIIPGQPDERPLTDLFARMYAELQGDYIYKYDFLRTLLMEVIHTALKMSPPASQPMLGNAAERIAALFNELLERQFPIESSGQVIRLSTPSQFATQLNVHVNHLNKTLKTITGHSTIHLINSRLLDEAKILLKSTTWSIQDIAWSLGFTEPNHFSSFFSHRMKITPNQYRRGATD